MSRNRSKPSPKTADEVMAELDRDPEYQSRTAAKERERIARAAKNRDDVAPLLAELKKSGFEVGALSELLAMGSGMRKAIPMLLAWLPRVSNIDVKEDIVRTMSVPFAKPVAARPLVEEFRSTDDDAASLRWAIGNALEVVADDSIVEDMIELAKNSRYGSSRQMVVLGLGKLKDPRVIPVLVELLKDETVCGHALGGLARLKPLSARLHIEPLLKHPKSFVRNEAKKALAKIDKAGSQVH